MAGFTILPDEFSEIYEDVYEELNTISDHIVLNTSYTGDHAQPCEVHPFPQTLKILNCIIYMLIFLLAIPGNMVVGLVVGSSRYKLSPSDLFLFHLAIADIMLAVTMPLWSVYFLQGWVFGDGTCKIVSMVLEANFYTSILFLVCISADRYMVVVHASKEGIGGQNRHVICSWITCASVWTLGLMLSLPAAIYYKSYPSQKDGKMECGEHYETSSAANWRIATRILHHFLGFLLPLGAMLGFYGVIIARLVRTRGFRRQRAMKVIIAVVVAFLLCWCPNHLAVMVDTLVRAKVVSGCQRSYQTDLALQVTKSLGMLHCCINPILYAFVGEKFRANLKRLMAKRRVVERESSSRFSRLTSLTSQDGNNTLM
ncbi:C-X-C chemokine receptor type 1-like [Trichomycterus rosablanca]|uniref:C-X-C chemokine receptor type 1-like n=1 Tax=Trichomycterus rosablanca TaxID=2290929 RepID=UPI002F358C5E